MKKFLASLLLLAAGAAMGNTVQAASASDCITSAFGVELNPIGAVPACIGGFAFAGYCETLPEPDKTQCLHTLSSVKWGATASNLLVLAGAAAAAPVVGLVAAAAVWQSGAEKREFARLCRVHEELAGHPMHCNYTPTHGD
jgi:hypothetical protein